VSNIARSSAKVLLRVGLLEDDEEDEDGRLFS
jgi:hypothetical protein